MPAPTPTAKSAPTAAARTAARRWGIIAAGASRAANSRVFGERAAAQGERPLVKDCAAQARPAAAAAVAAGAARAASRLTAAQGQVEQGQTARIADVEKAKIRRAGAALNRRALPGDGDGGRDGRQAVRPVVGIIYLVEDINGVGLQNDDVSAAARRTAIESGVGISGSDRFTQRTQAIIGDRVGRAIDNNNCRCIDRNYR
ncbi:MAG: hypothetical protein BWY64_02477 [bacterium ADurb.Bin363]|nr:MAG: hypothetical protein BWY64_02477 [bacterium ADurb.Bin363]